MLWRTAAPCWDDQPVSRASPQACLFRECDTLYSMLGLAISESKIY